MGSGAGTSRGQGVVVLLSKLRFRSCHIRFQPELPGRILHVRITKGCSSLDVVAVYQHVWAIKHGESMDQLLHRRRRVWDGLQRLLARLPKRNRVVVGGDFNCSLQPHTPHVGPGAFPCLSNSSQDQDDLQTLVVHNHLCAINTWKSTNSHTFELHTDHVARTLIDYLLVPCGQAHGHTRRVRFLHDCPVGAW